MNHTWKEITTFDDSLGLLTTVEQCEVCNIVRRKNEEGADYYWRGEEHKTKEPENDCAKNEPVPLATILQDGKEMLITRQIWTLLHYNTPQTRITTILEGLEQIFAECGHQWAALAFKRAKDARDKNANEFLKALMAGEFDDI